MSTVSKLEFHCEQRPALVVAALALPQILGEPRHA
jgi:hypothetical protein